VDELPGNEVRNAAIGSRRSGPRRAAGRTTGGRLVSATGWSPASAIRSSVLQSRSAGSRGEVDRRLVSGG
jgi:hypothetical protein